MPHEIIQRVFNFLLSSIKTFTIIVYIVIIILLYINSSNINNSQNSLDMIRTLDNACITISSITVAAIIAIMTIIATRSPQKPIKWTVFSIATPSIIGVLTSLFSLYFSYDTRTFDASKTLFALTMGFTIVGIFVLFFIINYEKDKFLRSRKDAQKEVKVVSPRRTPFQVKVSSR